MITKTKETELIKTNTNHFYHFALANTSMHSINIDLGSSVGIKAATMQIWKLYMFALTKKENLEVSLSRGHWWLNDLI